MVEATMKKTSFSLFYVAGYLSLGFLIFLALPQMILSFLFSNGSISDLTVRLLAVLLFSLAIIEFLLIRLQADDLYGMSLIVRTLILIALSSFTIVYKEPLMIVLLVIVGVGLTLTFTSYIQENAEMG
jgi:hypothetical protein